MHKSLPIVLALTMSLSNSFVVVAFSSVPSSKQQQQWVRASAKKRQAMVGELLRTNNLIGMSISETRTLLGQPDKQPDLSSDIDRYALSATNLKSATNQPLPLSSLDIQFQNGVVSRYRITNRRLQPDIKVVGGVWSTLPDLEGWTKNQWALNRTAVPFNREVWMSNPGARLSMLSSLSPQLLEKTHAEVKALLGKPNHLEVQSGLSVMSYELSEGSCLTGGDRRFDLQFSRGGKLSKMRVATYLSQPSIIESGDWVE